MASRSDRWQYVFCSVCGVRIHPKHVDCSFKFGRVCRHCEGDFLPTTNLVHAKPAIR